MTTSGARENEKKKEEEEEEGKDVRTRVGRLH
jgi:hypothetical protein